MDNQNYNYPPAPVNAPTAKQVMIFGIIAIALAELGLPGLILAVVAKKKAADWTAAYGPFTGKAKVGNILAKVALPVSIVMMVFWIVYITACIFVGIFAGINIVQHANDSLAFLLAR